MAKSVIPVNRPCKLSYSTYLMGRPGGMESRSRRTYSDRSDAEDNCCRRLRVVSHDRADRVRGREMIVRIPLIMVFRGNSPRCLKLDIPMKLPTRRPKGPGIVPNRWSQRSGWAVQSHTCQDLLAS